MARGGPEVDATVVSERWPLAPTARTATQPSSSCSSSRMFAAAPASRTFVHVGDVVFRNRTSYRTAPGTGFEVTFHFWPPDARSHATGTPIVGLEEQIQKKAPEPVRVYNLATYTKF